MKHVLFFSLLLFSSICFANTEAEKTFYVVGMEDVNSSEVDTFKKQNPDVVFYNSVSDMNLKTPLALKKPVSKLSTSQSSASLKDTLQSFQDSIKGLCISQVELNLAFSVSAKAWVVVTGAASASACSVPANRCQFSV